MKKLTTSETLFFALILLSALGIIPSILWIMDRHPLAAKLLAASVFGVLAFILVVLWEKNPRVGSLT